MQETLIHEKAESIRDVVRYMRRFNNAIVVIYIDETVFDSPVMINHIKDICLLHESGLKPIIVPGASKRIDQILSSYGISWTYHQGSRITGSSAMPLIKMAAFDVSNQIMTSLAGEKKTALIGNWVRARSKGVIDGLDHTTSGEIEHLDTNAVLTVLENGFIPIFPCIGWSAAGKPYNISSIQLAQQVASCLHADKLFYLVSNAEITPETFTIPQDISVSPEGTVPAMDLDQLEEFFTANEYSVTSNSSTTEPLVNSFTNNGISAKFTDGSVNSKNSGTLTTEHSVVPAVSRETNSAETAQIESPKEKIINLLHLAKEACTNGVSRVHILNASVDGTIPCEIFSDLGSGTMIYESNYGGIRNMTRDDISSVLSVMQPFIKSGILLPRTSIMLNEQFNHYIVYEIDGAIRACASLVPFADGQMEIAGVAVEKTWSHIGIGPKLVSFLVERAKKQHAASVFILTTQTADWFEQLGFVSDSIDSLPEKRREKWDPKRGSKVMRLKL